MSRKGKCQPFLRQDVDVPKSKLRKAEKAVVFGVSSLSAAGIATSALGDTYMMLTSEAAEGSIGMSLAIPGTIVPFLVIGLCVLSVVLGGYIVYRFYNDYVETAEKLFEQINELNTRNQKLTEELQDNIHCYFIAILQAYLACMFLKAEESRNKALNELRKELASCFSMQFVLSVERFIKQLKQKEELYFALTGQFLTVSLLQTQVNDQSLQSVYLQFSKEIANKFQSLQPQYIKKPKLSSALLDGSLVSIDMYSNILSGSWFVFMTVMTFMTVVTTPVTGWLIFASALLLGAGLGLAFAYYKFKNVRRNVRCQNLESMQNALMKQDKTIKKELERINAVVLENTVTAHLHHAPNNKRLVPKVKQHKAIKESNNTDSEACNSYPRNRRANHYTGLRCSI